MEQAYFINIRSKIIPILNEAKKEIFDCHGMVYK